VSSIATLEKLVKALREKVRMLLKASQERSMSLERHRHSSKLSTFIQSEKYFSVPVTELQ
jgi:hypothetical protein